MFNLTCHLTNPFDQSTFKMLWFLEGKTFLKNKFWENQINWCPQYIFEIDINVCLKGKDHAGISISLNLLGLNIMMKMYDCRHWDNESNCWKQLS